MPSSFTDVTTCLIVIVFASRSIASHLSPITYLTSTKSITCSYFIPKLIGEISGNTARKSIKQIQQHNEGDSERISRVSSHKSHASRPSNNERGGDGTEKISAPKNSNHSNETTLLTSNETTLLVNSNALPVSNETTVLINDTVNKSSTQGVISSEAESSVDFKVMESLSSFDKNEIIE